MTKTELVKRYQKITGMSQKRTAELMDGFFDMLRLTIAREGQVRIPNFGTFYLTEMPSRGHLDGLPKETSTAPRRRRLRPRKSVTFSPDREYERLLLELKPGITRVDFLELLSEFEFDVPAQHCF